MSDLVKGIWLLAVPLLLSIIIQWLALKYENNMQVMRRKNWIEIPFSVRAEINMEMVKRRTFAITRCSHRKQMEVFHSFSEMRSEGQILKEWDHLKKRNLMKEKNMMNREGKRGQNGTHLSADSLTEGELPQASTSRAVWMQPSGNTQPCLTGSQLHSSNLLLPWVLSTTHREAHLFYKPFFIHRLREVILWHQRLTLSVICF